MKRLARYCLLLTFTIASLPISFAQDSLTWQRYTASGEEFSALLPEVPTLCQISRPVSLFEKPKNGRMYAVYSDGTAYVILSLDNTDRKEPLEVFVNEFPEYRVFHAGFEFEHEVNLNGLKGKQYRLSAANVSGVVQFYLTDKHAYVFVVVGEDLTKPSVNQFLVSLTLDGKTKGKVLASISESSDAVTTASPSTQPSTNAASQSTAENHIYNPKDVTRKAVLVTSPQPEYTEEARKNEIAGTVVIRAVFSSSGKVEYIRTVSGLPYGLSERAVLAAKQIKFLPAIKDGKRVSQYIQIEYNFSLY